MFAGLMTRRVTVKRPLYGETDRYGNDAPTWSDDTSWFDALAWVQPVVASEAQDDKERRVSEYRLFLPASTEVEATFRIQLEGDDVDMEIIGEPQVFHTPVGAHHIELTVRRVEG